MKKAIVMTLFLIAFMSYSIYALDTALREKRDEVYAELAEVKALMRNTQDPVLISSIYDSCLITVSQLDAYFHMLTIFNTIERKNLRKEAVDSLADWLGSVKNMNILNIKSLSDTSQALSKETKTHMERLSKTYNALNEKIDAELKKVDSIKKSLKLR
jgi:chlorite dismutase